MAKDNLEYYLEITDENLENIENREAHVSFDFMLTECLDIWFMILI